MRVSSRILQHELIGLHAKIEKSSHPNYVGISGRVIDETHNTIVIQHKNKRKIFAKKATIFHFTLPNGTVIETDGNAIIGRPENRIKKRIKRRW